MMNDIFTETTYELVLKKLFAEELNYQEEYGTDVERDIREPYYKEDLVHSLRWLNNNLPEVALKEAFRKVTNITDGTLEKRNETFMDYLQNGMEVKYYWEGKEHTNIVKLVDFNIVELNSFKIINQWTVDDIEKIRLAIFDGIMDDSAAERINEAFSDGFGDVILEFDGERYVVIDDYREDVSKWLEQMK